VHFAVTTQNDDVGDADTMTSSASKQTEEVQLPVILEPPLLVPSGQQSAPLFGKSQPFPDNSAEKGMAEVEQQRGGWNTDEAEPETDVEETGFLGTTVESPLADEGPAEEEEWSWRYDEHGKKIWYRKTGTDGDQGVPEGHAGTIRFATRPVPTVAAATSKPHGYWMLDDRGTYLWYRFVETGQYVRDPDVEKIDQENVSPDEQPRAREKLTWTGVGR